MNYKFSTKKIFNNTNLIKNNENKLDVISLSSKEIPVLNIKSRSYYYETDWESHNQSLAGLTEVLVSPTSVNGFRNTGSVVWTDRIDFNFIHKDFLPFVFFEVEIQDSDEFKIFNNSYSYSFDSYGTVLPLPVGYTTIDNHVTNVPTSFTKNQFFGWIKRGENQYTLWVYNQLYIKGTAHNLAELVGYTTYLSNVVPYYHVLNYYTTFYSRLKIFIKLPNNE